ncbi:uncharacterized protein N7498_000048 [Penicillium cinerascens]|uniref:Uncharacterized protein n=1 Tax=Penicillium cinerascens TaxID=70096 RepID=A0A9W9NDQ7_9EURO|nr:uncharacterized protein N7498_000048 [Penicillium cinerascens]KAJ5217949.1 hypothetical protein N7498_000048 [Penicillium cinerascens]
MEVPIIFPSRTLETRSRRRCLTSPFSVRALETMKLSAPAAISTSRRLTGASAPASVGRGDEPTTRLENDDSYFAGGDRCTTYSATPQYITSTSRVFDPSQESTAYANFDFRDPRAVTLRYAAMGIAETCSWRPPKAVT